MSQEKTQIQIHEMNEAQANSQAALDDVSIQDPEK